MVDTGPGIPAADQDHIFGEFTRRETPNGDHPAGTGLGLAISRRLALLLGGTVTVDSAVGEGSTFTLILPESPPASEDAPVVPVESSVTPV